jgi:hypothetical protein
MYFDVMISFSLKEYPQCDKNSSIYKAIVKTILTSDSIFGLAGYIWPLLYSLADIIASKASSKPVLPQAMKLALQLRDSPWSTPDCKPSPIAYTSHEALIQIADAHRFSALLVLYTDILGGEISPEMCQEAYISAFNALLRAFVLTANVMLTTLWPTHIIAMRATSTSDRVILDKIFAKIWETHKMNVVRFAWEEVRERWDGGFRGREGGRREILFA